MKTFEAALAKALLCGSLIALGCSSGWAQGKISFANDSVHLAYYDGTCGALAGSPISSFALPAGVTLAVDLYAGTSALSLVMLTSSTTSFGSIPGKWTTRNIVLPTPGGSTNWFQIQIRDAAYPDANTAAAAGSYAGFSPVFSAVPGTGITYPPLYVSTYPASSTWAPGTFNLDSIAAGDRGAISVGLTGGVLSPPTIVNNPASLTLPIGATATFQVGAYGIPPLTYQWFFGTNTIQDATNSVLTITNAQPSQSGQYQVMVSNPYGSTPSTIASLSVLAALDVHMVPAISLIGAVGQTYRLQYMNIGDPASVWTDLATVTVTNLGQIYVDLTAIGQAARYYRLVQVP